MSPDIDPQRMQAELAEEADKLAAHAEDTAGILDQAAERGDADRRHALAQWEREVADVERRNAERLRRGDTADLEGPPPKPAVA